MRFLLITEQLRLPPTGSESFQAKGGVGGISSKRINFSRDTFVVKAPTAGKCESHRDSHKTRQLQTEPLERLHVSWRAAGLKDCIRWGECGAECAGEVSEGRRCDEMGEDR
eukprot:767318-Hanusia_phi.AAC.3